MKNKHIPFLLLISSSAFVAFWAAGCSRHHEEPPHLVTPTPHQEVTTPVQQPPTAHSSAEKSSGKVYVASNGQAGADQNELVPRTVSFENPKQPALSAMKSLIAAPNSPIPNGTTIKHVKIVNGLATVDFSHEFKDNFHGGETQESQTIDSVLKTLGQFSDVKQVQILVEGKPIEALSNFEISKPLEVIRPESDTTKSDAGKADSQP